MKVFGNKILVRITQANRESIYTKEITRVDGTKVNLFKTVPVDYAAGDHSARYVQTAIVEAIGDDVEGIEIGDTALIDYNVCNQESRFVYKDGDDEIYWVEANTTYHEETLVAYANRKSPRDQIVYCKGEYDTLSSLLGVIRGDQIYARDPYVFFEHKPSQHEEKTQSGIVYTQKDKMLHRKVLAVSKRSELFYGIKEGDTVLIDDYDTFEVRIDEKYVIDCVNDMDILGKVVYS